jgi:hypothetical protein
MRTRNRTSHTSPSYDETSTQARTQSLVVAGTIEPDSSSFVSMPDSNSGSNGGARSMSDSNRSIHSFSLLSTPAFEAGKRYNSTIFLDLPLPLITYGEFFGICVQNTTHTEGHLCTNIDRRQVFSFQLANATGWHRLAKTRHTSMELSDFNRTIYLTSEMHFCLRGPRLTERRTPSNFKSVGNAPYRLPGILDPAVTTDTLSCDEPHLESSGVVVVGVFYQGYIL